MGMVLLVRHGQASFGADDYDVLSDLGWTQSRMLGAWLGADGLVPDLVVRGDMRRHRETAQALIEGAGWDIDVSADAGWNEFDHLGVIAALGGDPPAAPDRRAFQRLFESATARWTSGAYDDDYAESYSDFASRVSAALARAAEGGTVVVVSSGGPIAAACASLVLDSTPAVWSRFNTVVVNTSVTRVISGTTGRRMLTFNEHPHLTPDTLSYR